MESGLTEEQKDELLNKWMTSWNGIIEQASDAISYIVINKIRTVMKDPRVKARLNQGVLTYIAAAGALTFSGRDVDRDSVSRLIKAVELRPEDELLEVMTLFRNDNALVYMMAIYFLNGAAIEPNVKNLLEIVKAEDVTPDLSSADNMLLFYRDFQKMEKEGKVDYSDSDSYVILIADVVKKVAAATTYLITSELKRGLSDPRIRSVISEEFMPYVAAAGHLAYIGKDIDRWGVAKLVKAIGLIPEDQYLDALSSLRYKNHVVYLISIYYLVAAGKEPNVDNLINVVRAMYIQPDATLAAYAIRVFNQFSDQQK